jgi:hypothetical protein
MEEEVLVTLIKYLCPRCMEMQVETKRNFYMDRDLMNHEDLRIAKSLGIRL